MTVKERLIQLERRSLYIKMLKTNEIILLYKTGARDTNKDLLLHSGIVEIWEKDLKDLTYKDSYFTHNSFYEPYSFRFVGIYAMVLPER